MHRCDLAWRVGGPQGSGIDTAAALFATAVAAAGLHLHGRREYYSNIKGRHSYYDVRVAPHSLTCHRTTVDLLATYEAEALVRHANSVVPGGAILYDQESVDTSLDRITFLDERLRGDLERFLAKRDLPATGEGLLEEARRRGVQTAPVTLKDITDRLATELELPSSRAYLTANTVVVALSCALLGLDRKYVDRALESVFFGRKRTIEMNLLAVGYAYDYVQQELGRDKLDLNLAPGRDMGARIMVNGTKAVAMGKLAAGLSFQTYYPISPATDESVYLEAHETFPLTDGGNGSVVVVQTEDELAAVTMASGAALTGARAATATSGPGVSLMTEGLGWAVNNEVPLVVTLYQRGGPSTGLPTRTDQGDLQYALRAGHGHAPHIVVASGDLEEAFRDAAEVFNYAERYQTVVIHLLDKALASTTQALPPFAVDQVTIDRGELVQPGENSSDGEAYPRFRFTESGVSPRVLLGQPRGMHWLTGAEHTELGRVTEDPLIREKMMEKRARKLGLAARELPVESKFRVYGDEDARLTILGWGSTKGAILEALEGLDEEGITARFIHVRLLSPFPSAELTSRLEPADPIVVVETAYAGGFAQLIREQTGFQVDHLIVKYNGRPIAAGELLPALIDIHEGEAGQRIVLRNQFE